jgi:hypothetical protein
MQFANFGEVMGVSAMCQLVGTIGEYAGNLLIIDENFLSDSNYW